MTASTRIGTSGWSYDHWRGVFYPDDLAVQEWLSFYAARFRTVEINSSFYQLPERRTLSGWVKAVPPGFVFAAKASRYITHMKKLKDPKKSTKAFFRRIDALGDRLGPILFQLPPRWRFDGPRLEAFLRSLSTEFRYAFEFRDRSWVNEQTTDLLARHNAAFCIYDLAGFQSPLLTTADFRYVRLHGPRGAYQGSYEDATLAQWSDTLSAWSAEGGVTYCYFNNDQRGYAADDAARLLSLLHMA